MIKSTINKIKSMVIKNRVESALKELNIAEDSVKLINRSVDMYSELYKSFGPLIILTEKALKNNPEKVNNIILEVEKIVNSISIIGSSLNEILEEGGVKKAAEDMFNTFSKNVDKYNSESLLTSQKINLNIEKFASIIKG